MKYYDHLIWAVILGLALSLAGCSHVHEWEEYEVLSEGGSIIETGYKQSSIKWWWE